MNKTILRVIGAVVVAALAATASTLSATPRIALGIIIAATSLALIIIGRRHLGASFSVLPAAKGLVKTGLYSRIEHPLYTFLDIFLIGIIIALNIPVLLWVWGALVVVHLVESRREEKVLESAYGEEYAEYRSRTWF